MVFTDRGHIVMTDAIGIIRIISKDAKLKSIILVESVLGAKPHKSFAVLKDTHHCICHQPVLRGDMCKLDVVVLGIGILTGKQEKHDDWKDEVLSRGLCDIRLHSVIHIMKK